MIDEATSVQKTVIPVQERLYPKLLGVAWESLDPAVRRVHTAPGEIRAEGMFQVSRGPGGLIGLVLDAARVPASSRAAEVQLVVSPRGLAERWHRAFGGVPLVTHQSEAPGGLLAERIGVLEFRFRLAVKDGALLYRQEGFALCLGMMRILLPDWLAIKIAGREGPADGIDGPGDRTTVDVRVTAPTGDLLFAYRGTVRWSVRS